MSDRMGTTELRVLQEIRDLLGPVNQEHQHQFVIPVEWKYAFSEAGVEKRRRSVFETPTRGYVTKLRCACGEETDR